ncbi:MAG: S-methyl-5-thioribose-1-phosphate isomerase, partial [Lentisphaerae bacterium]
EEIFDAIRRLVVRGAPAIGCAAAYGLAAIMQAHVDKTPAQFMELVHENAAFLNTSRPTAVNLSWALKRCEARLQAVKAGDSMELWHALWQEADAILNEDIAMCRRIGEFGAELIQDGCTVLTHCNAGALATGDYGTALSPMYVAHEKGVRFNVLADETRPLLQGSRLTAWELHRAGINVHVICDNMAGWMMKQKKVDLVIVGADRIAANGDTANKIGTYSVAVLAHAHGIPFYVAAPYSTIDRSLPDGSGIPIEERAREEITHAWGRATAPDDVPVFNPAFDVTPHHLIRGIITQNGILRPPFEQAIAELFA